jgi:hypothetical protein
MFPAIYGERERAAYRRARRWEMARELAPEVGLALLLLGSIAFLALVGR